MAQPKFSLEAAFRFGWEKTKKHFVPLLILGVAAMIANAIPSALMSMARHSFALRGVFQIVAWVVQIVVGIGIIKALLMISQDIIPKPEQLIPTSTTAINFVLGTILYCLIVGAGLILFIVPGIIWGIKYRYISYLIIDKNMSAMDALKKSGEMTYGEKWNLFVYYIVAGLIIILGALAFGIGLVLAIPVVALAEVFVYRALLK